MTIQRPDLLLTGTYLKYFGWMTLDKAAVVRAASFSGLHAPFKVARADSFGKSTVDTHDVMKKVMDKFVSRITDCTIDVNVYVQQVAMSLLLTLLSEGLIDDVEDDNFWNQINLRSWDPSTTSQIRRVSLYFVMEQMEAFDEDEEPARGKRVSLAQFAERMVVQRIDALATWYVNVHVRF